MNTFLATLGGTVMYIFPDKCTIISVKCHEDEIDVYTNY